MYQHNLKWHSFINLCKNCLLFLAQTNTLLISKPGYLNNLLKRRATLNQIRTLDYVILDGDITRGVVRSRAFSFSLCIRCSL